MSNTLTTPRHVNVTRYVTPLREGGSLPAIAEADDDFLYVLKFRGAGQGIKSLIADFIGGEIARVLGLKVPEMVFAHLDADFGRTEGDEEIQDLLRSSEGLNLGVHYLQSSMTYDPAVTMVNAELASKIVWLDCFLTNVDRTVRNTNMLWWNKELWLIDHGAALYFHHSWDDWEKQATKPFAMIKNHVLLNTATELQKADEECSNLITPEIIKDIIAQLPNEWLTEENSREVYGNFLIQRLQASNNFVKEAENARELLV